jgi:hypothetical protein
VGIGQNTSALAATAVNLNGSTIQDDAGNAANGNYLSNLIGGCVGHQQSAGNIRADFRPEFER